MSNTPTIAVAELVAPLRKGERRRKRRAGVSLALRVRPADAKDGTFEEVRATRNASRDGLYFITPTKRYYMRERNFASPFPTGHLQASAAGKTGLRSCG